MTNSQHYLERAVRGAYVQSRRAIQHLLRRFRYRLLDATDYRPHPQRPAPTSAALEQIVQAARGMALVPGASAAGYATAGGAASDIAFVVGKSGGDGHGKAPSSELKLLPHAQIDPEVTKQIADRFLATPDYFQTYRVTPENFPSQRRDVEYVTRTVEPTDAGRESYTALRALRTETIRRVRAQLEQLRATGDTTRRGEPDGDELDVDAVIDYQTSVRTHMTPDDGVFTQNVRGRRDVTSVVVGDLSGSMAGEELERAKQALIVLGESLDQIGDRYAIIGYSSGDGPVRIHRVKDFRHKLDRNTRGRIGAMEAGGGTPTGPAIRYGAEMLRKERSSTKLLFVLTDGEPNDGEAGIQDVRAALDEASRLGIRSYCITLDSSNQDAFERMYGKHGYCVNEDVSKLPEDTADMYRKLAA